MIFDKISNHTNYRGILKELDNAFDYLLNTDLNSLENGKHIISGDKLYAVCMEYETKAESLSKNEAHRKYIDVQFIVKGEEKIHISEINGLKVTEEYNENNDVVFYENRPHCTLSAAPGFFAVFFPEDAHMPGINPVSGINRVRKVVVKVHV